MIFQGYHKKKLLAGVLRSVLIFGLVTSFFGLPVVGAADERDFFAGGLKNTADGGRKIIALTFDDGPGATTEEVLALLKKYNFKATFFVLGVNLKGKGKDLLRRIEEEGHEVGNHTFSHINFYKYAKPDKEDLLREEIGKTQKAVLETIGRRTTLLRMPNGYNANWSRRVARSEGYTMVNWSFGCDWMGKSDEETTKSYLVEGVKPGAILLFHDGGSKQRVKTINALKAVLEKLYSENYEVVTVGKMLEMIGGGQGGNRTHTGP